MTNRSLTVVAMALTVTWFVDTCHGAPPPSDDSVPRRSWRLNSESRRELSASMLEARNRSNDIYWKLNQRFKNREGFVATSSKATMMWVISSHLHELLRLRLDQTQLGHARVQAGVEDLAELHFQLKRDLRAWGVAMNPVPGSAATGLQRDLQKLESALDELGNVVLPEPTPPAGSGAGSSPADMFEPEPPPEPAAEEAPAPEPPPEEAAVPDPIKVN